MVKAANGKDLPAMTVFSMTLNYFRNHALRELADATGSKVLEQDVRWVITVPAIWRQNAKQFMREAAYEACIGNAQLLLQRCSFCTLGGVFKAFFASWLAWLIK